ncbi:hypothetical protein J3R83DRAFT_13384 [Lanmaoa asiatica]|nr:hypothetical protein J3R83DRAFT_13384 [Lanmaoa asiatica]
MFKGLYLVGQAVAKKELFAELAKYIFVEKEQALSLEEWGTQKAQAYVMATQRRHQILKNKYTECLKSLGETGAGLMVKDLQGSQYKNMLGKILNDFPWFESLHGWWKNNPAYNTVYSTAHTGQDFAAQAATLFGLQGGDISMVDDPAAEIPLFPSASTTPTGGPSIPNSTTQALANLTSPDGDSDIDMQFQQWFQFDETDFGFGFNSTAGSTSTMFNATAAATSKSTMPPDTTTTTYPDFSNNFSDRDTDSASGVIDLSIHTAPARPPPLVPRDRAADLLYFTGSSTTSTQPPPPRATTGSSAVPNLKATTQSSTTQSSTTRSSMSLLSAPLTDDSDSDAAAASLFANLQLKRKTPTPDVSSEESDLGKSWFSRTSQSSSTGATSGKRARTSVANRIERATADMPDNLYKSLSAYQEKKASDRRADLQLKQSAREGQRKHEREMQREIIEHEMQQQQHNKELQRQELENERVISENKKQISENELRKLQLQVELQRLKVQEQAMKVGHSGEDDES